MVSGKPAAGSAAVPAWLSQGIHGNGTVATGNVGNDQNACAPDPPKNAEKIVGVRAGGRVSGRGRSGGTNPPVITR